MERGSLLPLLLLPCLSVGALSAPAPHLALDKPSFVFRVEAENSTEIYFGFKRSDVLKYEEEKRANASLPEAPGYDHHGAMYFAVAVILIYGITIAFLIGTTLRKSRQDDEVKGFLRSYASLDDRKWEKQRVRKALKEKNLLSLVSETSMVAVATGAGAVVGRTGTLYKPLRLKKLLLAASSRGASTSSIEEEGSVTSYDDGRLTSCGVSSDDDGASVTTSRAIRMKRFILSRSKTESCSSVEDPALRDHGLYRQEHTGSKSVLGSADDVFVCRPKVIKERSLLKEVLTVGEMSDDVYSSKTGSIDSADEVFAACRPKTLQSSMSGRRARSGVMARMKKHVSYDDGWLATPDSIAEEGTACDELCKASLEYMGRGDGGIATTHSGSDMLGGCGGSGDPLRLGHSSGSDVIKIDDLLRLVSRTCKLSFQDKDVEENRYVSDLEHQKHDVHGQIDSVPSGMGSEPNTTCLHRIGDEDETIRFYEHESEASGGNSLSEVYGAESMKYDSERTFKPITSVSRSDDPCDARRMGPVATLNSMEAEFTRIQEPSETSLSNISAASIQDSNEDGTQVKRGTVQCTLAREEEFSMDMEEDNVKIVELNGGTTVHEVL